MSNEIIPQEVFPTPNKRYVAIKIVKPLLGQSDKLRDTLCNIIGENFYPDIRIGSYTDTWAYVKINAFNRFVYLDDYLIIIISKDEKRVLDIMYCTKQEMFDNYVFHESPKGIINKILGSKTFGWFFHIIQGLIPR